MRMWFHTHTHRYLYIYIYHTNDQYGQLVCLINDVTYSSKTKHTRWINGEDDQLRDVIAFDIGPS